jgi:hypothetical protein
MAECEYRGNGAPLIIRSREKMAGIYSNEVCNLLANSGGDDMLAPFCKAPLESERTCPVAMYYRKQIDFNTAQMLLDKIHNESYADYNLKDTLRAQIGRIGRAAARLFVR